MKVRLRAILGQSVAVPAVQSAEERAMPSALARTMPGYAYRVAQFAAHPPPSGSIALLGDSLTDALAHEMAWLESEGYPTPWSPFLRSGRIANRAIGGETTCGLLARLDSILAEPPAACCLMIGLNDLLIGREVCAVLESYRAITTRIRQVVPAERLIVQHILPTRTRATNERIAAVNAGLATLDATVVDVSDAVCEQPGWLADRYSADGVHLSGEGLQRWGERLVTLLPACSSESGAAMTRGGERWDR